MGDGDTIRVSQLPPTVPRRVSQKGIVYLSTIPPYMNVTRIKEIFGLYGSIGRVYLQLVNNDSVPNEKKSKRKIAKKFSEGWIEFEKKSVAKKVALLLNNTQVSARKKSKNYDCMWNIKYLSRFKWTHLHERLAYEKTVRRQKLQAETQLAKKKANFYTLNLDRNKTNKPFVNRELQDLNGKKTEVAEANTGNDGERTEFLESLFN